MRYMRCRCGKAERVTNFGVSHACQGCSECGSTFSDREQWGSRIEHDYELYYLGGEAPNPILRCRRCKHVKQKGK